MTGDEFDALLAPLKALLVKKGEDYNNIPLENYFPFGDKSHVQMIHVKTMRMVSLLTAIDVNKPPNFEGIVDTVQDCIAYNVFYLAYLRRKEDVKI